MSQLKVDSITDEAGTGAPDFPNGLTGLPQLTQGQAEDPTSTVFGTVSGQRLEQQTNAAFNVTGSAPKYACRAWVNFDGQTTPPTIRASGNVSSVTRTATGDYTVNFTTAMPDTNYAALISQSRDNGANPPTPASTQSLAGTLSGGSTLKTTTQCRFGTGGNTSSYNATQISIAIIR